MRFARLLMFSLIFTVALPTAVFAAEKFVAQSSDLMTWAAAQKFCDSNGGKLPLVNSVDTLDKAAAAKGMSLDGFGVVGDKWPDGLPDKAYWTGTTVTDQPYHAFGINTSRGMIINVYPSTKHGENRVVCVPK